jgi:hypothetical protein
MVGNVAGGWWASASPPTASIHRVAMAMANHSRSARWGSVMWVYCHCQPPPLIFEALHVTRHFSAYTGHPATARRCDFKQSKSF